MMVMNQAREIKVLELETLTLRYICHSQTHIIHEINDISMRENYNMKNNLERMKE
jgi:hypothetical protein